MRSWKNKVAPLGIAILMVVNTMATTKIGVKYNGELMNLKQEPKVIQNSTMLPIRAISEELGYKVEWNQKTKEIQVTNGVNNVLLQVNKKTAYINGEEVEVTVPPKAIEGTTYVPLRFVGEALGIKVEWDSKNQCVNLEEGKYSVDKANKKLMLRAGSNKKAIADINTLEGDNEVIPIVEWKETKYGSELVTVSEVISGALTRGTSTTYYIKNGKVIDKIERPHYYICEAGVAYYKNQIAFCTERYLRIYDDETGEMMNKYDLNNFGLGEFGLDLMKIGKDYALGRSGNTLHIVDFKTSKIIKLLDYVPEQDKDYVFQADLYLATDSINLVWETEDTLVFKYYTVEGEEKLITYKIGQGII